LGNEKEAIRLCQDSLDYCTIAPDGTRYKFYHFKSGAVFYYAGQRKYMKRILESKK